MDFTKVLVLTGYNGGMYKVNQQSLLAHIALTNAIEGDMCISEAAKQAQNMSFNMLRNTLRMMPPATLEAISIEIRLGVPSLPVCCIRVDAEINEMSQHQLDRIMLKIPRA